MMTLKRCVTNACTSYIINNLQTSTSQKSCVKTDTSRHTINRVRVYLPLLSWLRLGWSWLVNCSGRRWRQAGAWHRHGSSRPRGTVDLESWGSKCAEYWNFLSVLPHWIPFYWQNAVFWIPTMRSGINSAKNQIRGQVNESSERNATAGGKGEGDQVFTLLLSGSAADNNAWVRWKFCPYVDAAGSSLLRMSATDSGCHVHDNLRISFVFWDVTPSTLVQIYTEDMRPIINPCPANVDNMASSYQC